VLVAADGIGLGVIGVADSLKPTSPDAIQSLKDLGIAVYLVTGDNERTAWSVARDAGIDENNVLANVLPDAKAEVVKNLQSRHSTVAMVGDGINDAPALAEAHVGIAMGSGTDAAREAASITIVGNDLEQVATAVKLSKATFRAIIQNLFWASIYNVIGIPVAAGALYPNFHILLSPVLASGAMAFSSLFVVLNSLRLKRFVSLARK
jgi:Cu+-exporting ATPase